MNEENIKKIMARSEVRTSSDFTDTLISNLQAKPKTVNDPPVWDFNKTLLFVVLTMGIMLGAGYFMLPTVFGSNTIVMAAIVFLFLVIINYLLHLKRTYQKLTT